MWENMDQRSPKYKHFLHSIYERIAEYVTARVKDDNLRKQKILTNISNLSEKQPIRNSSSRKYKFGNCCGFGKNHKLLTIQRGKYESFQTILGRIYWDFAQVLYKFDLSQLKPNI